MLLQELNLKSLNVSTSSVFPFSTSVNVEGFIVEFNISAFQTAFGSGKKSVISGSITQPDSPVSYPLENSDIESVRRKVSKLLGLKNERKPRAKKEVSEEKILEVDKLRQSLAVARRLPKEWVKIDTTILRAAFKDARKKDKAPKKLANLANLDAEKQLKAYEVLKKAGLI